MSQTILLVDDHDDTRQFMRALIENFGYKVSEATNGLEAVESVKVEAPDLILMDIGMPVMDGITAIKQIRKLKEGTNIPAIALMAHKDWFEEKALKAGCNEVIIKPVEQSFLRQVISDYLQAGA